MKRTPIALAATAAALTLLAGCGDDKPSDGSGAADADTSVEISDDTSSEPSSTPAGDPEPSGEPVAALRELLNAYLENDADTACGLQTERYTKEAIADAIKDDYLENGASCADLVNAAGALYKAFGVDPNDAQYEEISNDGQMAKVAYTEKGGDSTSTYVLVNTDGDWLLDDEQD